MCRLFLCSFLLFFSVASYANPETSIIQCSEGSDTFSHKLSVTTDGANFRLEISSALALSNFVEDLFPNVNNTGVLKMDVIFHRCKVSPSGKSLISCDEPLSFDYSDFNGKILNQGLIDYRRNPGFASTTINTELSTSGLVSWLNLKLILRVDGKPTGAEHNFEFFTESALCTTK